MIKATPAGLAVIQACKNLAVAVGQINDVPAIYVERILAEKQILDTAVVNFKVTL